MTRIISFYTALLVLAAATGLTAQGRAYRIAGDELVVDRRSLWQNWSFPEETLELSPSGEVRPLALRKDINAVPEIVRYLRLHPPPHLKNKEPEDITLADAVQAGSNPRDAVNVLDGDPTTYWEPDLTDAPPVELGARWWLMVDLGRNVIAKRLVLRFAEEELGDPFLQFDVLVSNGERPPSAAASKHPFFATVYRTLRPNKDVRVLDLTFEDVYTDSIVGEAPLAAILPPSTVDRNHSVQAPRELAGASLRYVMVVVRDSDFDRGRLVSPEAYAALPEDDKGAVVHHKLQRDGRLTELLSEADYLRLPAGQQGEILHYRKERPRLADIEVWTEGDNVLPAIYKRGGEISGNANLNYGRLVDGFVGSFTEVNLGKEGYVLFDLGATFWLDAYRLMYGGVTNRERRSFNSYDLEASDGSLNPDGTLKFKTVARRIQKFRRKDFEVHDFDLVKTRFFRLVFDLGFTHEQPHTAAPGEIYLYGRGYIAEVRMESGLVELGARRNLLSMSWEADTPPGTRISIQTRAGNELREVLHYYKADGTEISEKAYNNPSLLPSLKGDIVAEMVAGDDWSGWSQPYEDASGSPFLSPSPREFLNIAATLVSEDPDLHPTLRSLRLRFSNPVAQGLLAEVTPTRVDSLGVPRDFSLFLRPEFDNRDPGFDELLLRTPPDMSLEFAGLYAGTAEEFDGGGGTLVDVEVMPTDPDSLRLSFPIVEPGGIEVLRLDFRTALFTIGAQLQAAVKRTRDGEDAWQRVDPGDALASVDSEAITLIGEATGGSLLAGVDLSSPVITPNGDGINDEALFSLKVVRVADGSPVDLQIHDLGGRLVRRIVEHGSAGTGLYEIAWDGLDANGLLVPPGIYLVRLWVDTDDGGRRLEGREAVRTLAVSY